MKARLAIIVGKSGRGSNMAAIAKSCRDPQFPAEVVIVIGPSEISPALESAKGLELSTVALPISKSEPEALISCLKQYRVDIVCLAGFMRLLPAEVLALYPNRVLNIHPALLPKFGGKGMYGHYVHEAVLAQHENESGCTVHFVSEQYDEGKIILQRKCPVLSEDTPDLLGLRVLKEEHLAYSEAIRIVAIEAGFNSNA